MTTTAADFWQGSWDNDADAREAEWEAREAEMDSIFGGPGTDSRTPDAPWESREAERFVGEQDMAHGEGGYLFGVTRGFGGDHRETILGSDD